MTRKSNEFQPSTICPSWIRQNADSPEVDRLTGRRHATKCVPSMGTGHTTVNGDEVPLRHCSLNSESTARNSKTSAEMHVFMPDLRALCMAENPNGSMHNVLTLPGTLVRDAKAWSNYMTEALRLYCDRTEYLFASRLLRNHESQLEGRLPALSRLV
jgi:hypothetical protein